MITSGVVSFEDGRKAAEEYAPARKVRVELSFSVPEGADHALFLNEAAYLAKAKVKELIFGTPTTSSELKPVPGLDATAIAPPAKKPRAKKVEPLPPVEPFPGPTEVDAAKTSAASAPASQAIITEDVSDGALYNAVIEVNGKFNQPKKITEIIKQFCPNDKVPPSLKRVITEKRVEFLVALREFAKTATVGKPATVTTKNDEITVS